MKEILIEFYKIMLKNIGFILFCYLILVIIQIIYLYKNYKREKLLLFVGNKILILVSLIVEYYSNKYFGRYGIFAIFYVFGIYILNDNISTTQEEDLLEKEKLLIIDFMFFMLIGAILMSLSGILKI